MKTNKENSNWTEEQKRTHQEIEKLYAEIFNEEKEKKAVIEQYDQRIKKLHKSIDNLQERCNHIDEGLMFVASCPVCRWADFYSE